MELTAMEARAPKAPNLTMVGGPRENQGWRLMLVMILIVFWIKWIVIARMRVGMHRIVLGLMVHIHLEGMTARGNCISKILYIALALFVF
jgi:hypothetical protein